MCLLVVRKNKSNWLPTENQFNNAWSINSDGFGIAYTHKHQIHISKTLIKEKALELIHSIPTGAPAILHWRMGTHGSVSLDNVHPFDLPLISNERIAWVGAHNGVLSAQPVIKDLTDSEAYFRTIKKLSIKLIESDIARLGYGKMAFLSSQGQILLANESQGKWRSTDVWQSNSNMDDASYCGFGWRPHWRKPRRLTALFCDGCGSPTVAWADGAEMYCDGCADAIEEGYLR
jgi:hypothetical protein